MPSTKDGCPINILLCDLLLFSDELMIYFALC